MDKIEPLISWIDNICMKCEHFKQHDGFGCRAYPDGMPHGYPPNNKHNKILKGQVGDYVFTPMDKDDE